MKNLKKIAHYMGINAIATPAVVAGDLSPEILHAARHEVSIFGDHLQTRNVKKFSITRSEIIATAHEAYRELATPLMVRGEL